ncbi:MAG TPA: hypothetical protein VNU19_06960 [Candidatus Acidoferrum sp.]|nr:hypothetical protein [Candidatus Acidoferrum sp.]
MAGSVADGVGDEVAHLLGGATVAAGGSVGVDLHRDGDVGVADAVALSTFASVVADQVPVESDSAPGRSDHRGAAPKAGM